MNYIICTRHMSKKDGAILFWKKDSQGYTYNVLEAGKYEDKDIDMPVNTELVDSLAVERVIDNHKLGRVVINNSKNRRLLKLSLRKLRNTETAWDWSIFVTPAKFMEYNHIIIRVAEQIKAKQQIEKANKLRIKQIKELDKYIEKIQAKYPHLNLTNALKENKLPQVNDGYVIIAKKYKRDEQEDEELLNFVFNAIQAPCAGKNKTIPSFILQKD